MADDYKSRQAEIQKQDKAWEAEDAKLQPLKGLIIQEVRPQIEEYQKAYVSNKHAWAALKPDSVDNSVEESVKHYQETQRIEKADDAMTEKLVNAVSDALKKHGVTDAPRYSDRYGKNTPGMEFEVSIVDYATQTAPLDTPKSTTMASSKSK